LVTGVQTCALPIFGIEVCVKQGDVIALIEEQLGQMATNEAIASGDEYSVHRSPPPVSKAYSRRRQIDFALTLLAASFRSAAGAKNSSKSPCIRICSQRNANSVFYPCVL